MSGHNKWAQIKHKKAIIDAKRGQLFSKLVKEIMVAVKTGGSAPDTNIRLRSALLRAKEEGLPKENIDRAIMRASGQEEDPLQEFIYEATTTGGVMIVIEGITDNKNRTTAEIKHILSLHNAKLAEQGSLLWNFEKIVTVEISKEKNAAKSPEKIEEAIIESGARDLQSFGDSILVEIDFQTREDVRKKLELAGIVAGDAAHNYKAKASITLREEEKSKLEPLFDAILSHEDVQEVYTNIL